MTKQQSAGSKLQEKKSGTKRRDDANQPKHNMIRDYFARQQAASMDHADDYDINATHESTT